MLKKLSVVQVHEEQDGPHRVLRKLKSSVDIPPGVHYATLTSARVVWHALAERILWAMGLPWWITAAKDMSLDRSPACDQPGIVFGPRRTNLPKGVS